jgi:RNA polymerase sigma-70 factor (ECF subfamily)
MQVQQTKLPSQQTSVKPNAMSDKIPHKLLCQWLKAVADTSDKQAFTQLFKFFAPKILSLAKGKLNTETLASEAVQETMSNVWRKAHLFNEDKGAVTTWVYTIMRNVIFDILRKQQANKEDNLSDDIWPLAESAHIDEYEFTDHLESNEILNVISELPDVQQQVIKGFYFMEMSQEQLAKHLDLPLGTIKSRLRLALAKLKAQLGEQHND